MSTICKKLSIKDDVSLQTFSVWVDILVLTYLNFFAMYFKETITDNNDSLNERILSMISSNQIYHSMEDDAYQYDIEMEYGQQKVAQITKFIIETE